ncbi:MAG TPA: hypothetical protein DEO98_06020, partial [Legionellales bacterium]|nr:hypothetical protein [Legionellales bacterium]
MADVVLFEDSLLVAGAMCYDYCGQTLESNIRCAFDKLKPHYLPEDAFLSLYAEPAAPGVQRIAIIIEAQAEYKLDKHAIRQNLEKAVIQEEDFKLVQPQTKLKAPAHTLN